MFWVKQYPYTNDHIIDRWNHVDWAGGGVYRVETDVSFYLAMRRHAVNVDRVALTRERNHNDHANALDPIKKYE